MHWECGFCKRRYAKRIEAYLCSRHHKSEISNWN